MGTERWEESDRFKVIDENGNEHVVVEHTVVLYMGPRDNLGAPVRRSVVIRTEAGRQIVWLDDHYEILGDLDENWHWRPTVRATRID